MTDDVIGYVLTRTHVLDEYYDGQSDVAVIPLTRDKLETLEERADLAEELREENGALRIEWFDATAVAMSWTGLEQAGGPTLLDIENDHDELLKGKPVTLRPNDLDLDQVDDEEHERLDTCSMRITGMDRSIHWHYYVKHTDISVETASFQIAQVKDDLAATA